MKFEETPLPVLRHLAKSHGLKIKPCSKEEIIAILNANNIVDWPVKIEPVAEEIVITPTPQMPEYNKQAIYVAGRTLVQNVGIFEKGYHIVDKKLGQSLANRVKRIRLATPGEVAEYYGVK